VGSSVLGFSAMRLVRLGQGTGGREPGDGRTVASCRLSGLLAWAVAAKEPWWIRPKISSEVRHLIARMAKDSSHLGSPQNPWRAPEVGL